MKHVLLPITLAIVTALTIATESSRAQAPGNYDLHEVPVGASLHDVTATPAEYKGRKALKIEFTEAANKGPPGVDLLFDMPTFVLIPGNFMNGTIEVDLLGRLNGKGLPDARAFIGLAYRVVDGGARFESVYLRPLNGRKTNPPSPRDKRAIQYFAYPDWKFDRLRKEYPDGRYESGADICRRRMDQAQARYRRYARQGIGERQGGIRAEGFESRARGRRDRSLGRSGH
jgi:hypothetical protein